MEENLTDYYNKNGKVDVESDALYVPSEANASEANIMPGL